MSIVQMNYFSKLRKSLIALPLVMSPSLRAQSTGAQAFLIDPNRPVVYMHVERVGQGRTEEDGRRHERVWLSLHNNCALPIRILTFGAPAGDDPNAIGVMDELVPITIFAPLTQAQDREYGPKKMPQELWFDVGSSDRIEPNGEIRFSLPADHFSRRWAVQIPFSFDLPPGKGPRDDRAWGGTVQMYLSYSFDDLPDAVQNALQSNRRAP